MNETRPSLVGEGLPLARRMRLRGNCLVGVYCYQWKGRNLEDVLVFMGISKGVDSEFLRKGELRGRIRLQGSGLGGTRKDLNFRRGMWVVLGKNGAMGFMESDELVEVYEDGEALQDISYKSEQEVDMAIEVLNEELAKSSVKCKFDEKVLCLYSCDEFVPARAVKVSEQGSGGWIDVWKIEMPGCMRVVGGKDRDGHE